MAKNNPVDPDITSHDINISPSLDIISAVAIRSIATMRNPGNMGNSMILREPACFYSDTHFYIYVFAV